jgi:hypothetical protein
VKICGESAAICLAGSASINLDCAIPCTLPSSVILQVATVQTTPTGADYMAAATKYAVSAAIECFLFFATGGVAGAGQSAVANAVSLQEKGLAITFLKSINPSANSRGGLDQPLRSQLLSNLEELERGRLVVRGHRHGGQSTAPRGSTPSSRKSAPFKA